MPKSKKRLIIIIFAILAILYSSALIFYWRTIENDLQSRAVSALESFEFSWASLTTKDRGRDVLMLGVAPNQRELDKAISLVENVWGVRNVIFEGELELQKLKKPWFSLAMVDEAVSVDGNIGRDEFSVEIINYLKSISGQRAFINRLQLSDNVEVMDELLPLIKAVQCCKRLDLVKIENNKILVKGKVTSAQQKKDLIDAIEELFSRNYSIKSDVNVMLAPLQINDLFSKNECQKRFNSRLDKEKIRFVSSGSDIDVKSSALLKSLAKIAGNCKSQKLHIVGHTDATGSNTLNEALSTARANAVKKYLIKLGVTESRISYEGKGSKQPIASNKTRDGRAKNRRVQIIVR